MALLSSTVFTAVNHILARADWAQQRLKPFAGRRAQLQMPPWQIDFAINSSGLLEPLGANDGEGFDVEMNLPPDAWLALMRGPTEVIRSARIRGSAEFAEALGFVVTRIRWDMEEDLARLVGDIPAHRINGLFGGVVAWQRQALQRVAENIAEYLTEESAVLATPAQANRFVRDIDNLRDDVARLEKRLQRLG
jgi:ubiquinone biosynthesis protein UbiJ